MGVEEILFSPTLPKESDWKSKWATLPPSEVRFLMKFPVPGNISFIKKKVSHINKIFGPNEFQPPCLLPYLRRNLRHIGTYEG